MIQTSLIEISRSALLHNADFFRRYSGLDKLFAVVKGNAYGHGQNLVVSVLNKSKSIYGYQVYELFEALELRKITTKPLAVLGFLPNDKNLIRQASQAKITVPIYNQQTAKLLQNSRKPLQVQIKVDIGTHRLGFKPENIVTLIQTLNKNKHLTIRGVFSHYADSENNDQSFTNKQSKVFAALLTQLKQQNINLPFNHVACTAAMAKKISPHLTTGRLGIGLYGISPIEGPLQSKLRPVLTWSTKIMHLQQIPKGEYVGYARRYRTSRKMHIATVPVGYYDGYSR